jgi:hypothetical protein
MALYHFTCAHGRREIGTSNCLLLPHYHPLLGCKVLWLTDQSVPDREKTGLTMKHQPCDRMQFRYVISDSAHCTGWLESLEREQAPAQAVADLESFGDPEHWWIAATPIRARFDRSWALVSDKQG